MHMVDDSIETVHLYVVREEPKQPYTVLPLLIACLCLLVIAGLSVYSGDHPRYEHQTLTVPAQLLPPQTLTASVKVIPTGVKTYPATYATGTLTFSNGSVIGQSVPVGYVVDDSVTDREVYVPPATANGFGTATVPAHLLTAGINKVTLAINEVIGASLFVRNLSPFTGGKDAYSVKYVTKQDRQIALKQARAHLTSVVSGLHYPCSEQVSGAVTVTWQCLFVTYSVPTYMHITGVRLAGRNVIVSVVYIERPMPVHWVK